MDKTGNNIVSMSEFNNFTFTFSPGRLIPSPRQDGSIGSPPTVSQPGSVARRTPRTSPSPSDLLRNLDISGSSPNADLPNATLGNRPRRVPVSRRGLLPRDLRSASASGETNINGESIFGTYREPVAESTSSGSGTERLLSPATGPEGGDEIESGPTRRTSGQFEAGTQPIPPAAIYDRRLQEGLAEVKHQLGDLANTMRLSELVRDPNTSLHKLYEETRKRSEFKYPETRTVGFIGDSGAGKSSVINSLLDQAHLARSSGDGSACTSVVTEFRNSDGTHNPYTIEADFMSIEEMNELLEELLQAVRQYNIDSHYRELLSTEARQKCRDAADRAWVTLESLFQDEPELSLEYVSRDEEGAEIAILAQLQRWALIGTAHRPGGPNSLQYSITCGDLDECKHQLDTLTADLPGSNRPAQWPFIKLIRVYVDSPILHTGLVLADLPGLRDLNYARVRATEKYLSHNCDEVFIVSNISRCISDQSIQDIMKRCKEGQPRLIICTRSDDIRPEEVARGESQDALHVRQMNQRIREVTDQHRDTISRRLSAPASEQARISLQEAYLNDRIKTLELERKRYLVRHRNARVQRELAAKYTGITVFCVGNPMYSMHTEAPPDQPEGYIDLSGIRQLRRYCQLVPAQVQFDATSAFLNNQVPALLTSLRQWALAGADSVTAEKAASLRRILGNMEAVLCREFISRDAHISRAQTDLANLFNESVARVIRNFGDTWTRNCVEKSEVWATWNPQTYAAWCRHHGTHETRNQHFCCWNDEIIQRTREVLGPRWDGIIVWLESRIDALIADTAAVFSGLHRELEEHRHLAPQALGNIRAGMESRERCITDEIRSAFRKIVQATHLIERDMLHGHACSVIAGLMRPAYLACNRESGTGSDRRRKTLMRDHLASSGLFVNYAQSTEDIYLATVAEQFNAFQGRINDQVQRIVRDLQVVVVADGAAPEAEQAPALAEEMKSRVEIAQRAVGTVHIVLQELAQH